MAAIEIHPSELAYAFSYTKTAEVIGWGREPFLPAGNGAGDPAGWYSEGEERLLAAGRLVGRPETGLNFTEEMTSALLALVNPGLVLLAQRKAEGGLSTLTVHAAGDAFTGLTRRTDGAFELTRYAELTAAAAACASFVGASLAPLETEARVEANHQVLEKLRELSDAGQADKVIAALVKLGARETDAKSAVLALARPSAAGVLSVLYCANNVVEDVEAFSVLTNALDHTWILFPPASLEGPMILERSSVSALAARVGVGVAARLSVPG